MNDLRIRPAVAADLASIQAIYAHHVLHGTGSFEEAPPSVEVITARFRRASEQHWDWMVAADASGVLGFGAYSQYRDRSAYRFTAEDSVYVRDDVRGQGVGKALVVALLSHARDRGFRQMIAVIGDGDNIASVGVHASLGFHQVGVLRTVGFKFGRWLDAVIMQKTIEP